GGCSPSAWDKFVPAPYMPPPPGQRWNETLWPIEYPLSHHELSILLPHFLKEGRATLDVYFTRVFNPVWTYPDGASWMEVLRDESKVGLHVALTPTWNETAWFADYVLPMGHASERHDTVSMETHSGSWVSFRQPVLRTFAEKQGKRIKRTYEVNPGEVWEESEFFIELSWRIDPDGSMGIRKYFESPDRPGEMLTLDEYYGWMFEHSVPGLPEKAAAEGLSPLEYMRKYGAVTVEDEIYQQHMKEVPAESPGVEVDGVRRNGFLTPGRKLELFSSTVKDWGWPEHVLPGYIHSHVHPEQIDSAKQEFVLLPNFRLPTLIHTRSGGAKWLNEISHSNPVWINNRDAQRLGLQMGDLVRLSTEIGYFVARTWPTEGIAPGVVGCSHHMGRWRLDATSGPSRWSAALVDLHEEDGRWFMRQKEGIRPFDSADPDSKHIWWSDAGVHQNLSFPVQPDPMSGMHCWHQKVTVEKAHPDDRYADVMVDTNKAHQVYKRWLATTRPGPGPDGTRRPYWLQRPYRPAPEAYQYRASLSPTPAPESGAPA
ncbi:MAG: molybdopterin dinucleotide binding domain-containing protein, partial [Chloroflexota bacterium]